MSKYVYNQTPREELQELSAISEVLAAFSACSFGEQSKATMGLNKSSAWLQRLSRHVCGRGYIGCYGGDNCASDHK